MSPFGPWPGVLGHAATIATPVIDWTAAAADYLLPIPAGFSLSNTLLAFSGKAVMYTGAGAVAVAPTLSIGNNATFDNLFPSGNLAGSAVSIPAAIAAAKPNHVVTLSTTGLNPGPLFSLNAAPMKIHVTIPGSGAGLVYTGRIIIGVMEVPLS